MALRQVRINEDPVLHKEAREVKKINGHIQELIEDLFDTMYEEDGVGIAAPQVGVLRRIFVVDDREGNKYCFINPKLTPSGDQVMGMEGCLSVPEKQGSVSRYQHVKVDYLDENGEEKTLEADDFLARIIQHENDHLDGILYTEKAEKVYTYEELEEMQRKAREGAEGSEEEAGEEDEE